MSSLTLSREPAAPSLLAQLASCVEELGRLVGDGCLVESPEGRLVAHQLGAADLPALLITSLVAGDLCGLHQGLTSKRATGLLPSGAVVEGRLSGRRAAYLGLRVGTTTVGGVWLLPTGEVPLPLDELRAPVERLTSLLSCDGPGGAEPSLAACLEGRGPLPPALDGAERLWVAALVSPATADTLARALPTANTPILVRPVRCGAQVHVVLGGSRRVSGQHALLALQAVTGAAAAALGQPVTAVLSEVTDAAGLPAARQQAVSALSAAAPGKCAPLAALRSALVVRHLAASLPSVPDLGPDPFTLLLDYDRRRGGELADTLAAWLDAFGDIPRTSAVLSIHPNTLRYRLRRIDEIIGLELRTDPFARLELHVRLLNRTAGEST